MRRAVCALNVTARQKGRFAVAAMTADLTSFGARLSGAGPFEPDSEMWLRLPGLESLTVRVIWSHGPTTGIAFNQPLHTAVFARFLPVESRLTLVDTPGARIPLPADISPLPLGEHRAEERFGDALRSGPMQLTVGARPAQVLDVSTSGLRVAATLQVDVGTRVAVKFDGFDTIAARVVWRKTGEIGLSLPPGSLGLGDA